MNDRDAGDCAGTAPGVKEVFDHAVPFIRRRSVQYFSKRNLELPYLEMSKIVEMPRHTAGNIRMENFRVTP